MAVEAITVRAVRRSAIRHPRHVSKNRTQYEVCVVLVTVLVLVAMILVDNMHMHLERHHQHPQDGAAQGDLAQSRMNMKEVREKKHLPVRVQRPRSPSILSKPRRSVRRSAFGVETHGDTRLVPFTQQRNTRNVRSSSDLAPNAERVFSGKRFS